MPSGPSMKTCQPSSARASPLAIATTTLKRTVVVTSSPLDACTMKVTAAPYFRSARCRALAISVPAAEAQMRAGVSKFNCGRPSEGGFRNCVQGHAIEKILQGLLPSQLSSAIRPEAAFPKLDAHRPSLATYFPAPGVSIVTRSRNDNVERSAWRRTEHDQSKSCRIIVPI